MSKRLGFIKKKIKENREKMARATAKKNRSDESRDTTSADNKNSSRTVRPFVIDTNNKENGINSAEGGHLSATMAFSPTPKKYIELTKVENLSSFTAWIPVNRNRRMTEDQSVVGPKQIYYDQRGREALIDSDRDSDKEVINEEEENKEFTISEGEILRKTTKKFGLDDTVFNALAQCFSKKPCQIKARYAALCRRDIPAVGSQNGYCDATSSSFPEKDPYAPLHTFNTLFCRQCFVFICGTHGCTQNVIFPADKRPTSLTIEEQKSCEYGTTLEKSLLKKALEICVRNSENVLDLEADKGVPLAENSAEGDGQKMSTQQGGKSKFIHKRGKVRCSKFTKKSYRYSSVRSRISIKEGELNHHYEPCGCKSACGKDCLCLINRTHCEKYCGCPRSCKNRFRGCRCAEGQCRTRQCSCVMANRECDPDVCLHCFISCGDGTCGAPPQKEKSCMNMRLLQNQHQKVLLGRSGVSGWGAFIQNACEKDELIGEYKGELISHSEAEIRGHINSSYLFDLNDQYVVDALHMGNKLRFINHSFSPNCYAKILLVAGDHRVGIFASDKLSVGQELFLDYGYNEAVAPQWLKDYKASTSKDDEYTPSSRRTKRPASGFKIKKLSKKEGLKFKGRQGSRLGQKEGMGSKEDEDNISPRSQAKRKATGSKEDQEYTPSRSQGKRKASGSKKDKTCSPSRKKKERCVLTPSRK